MCFWPTDFGQTGSLRHRKRTNGKNLLFTVPKFFMKHITNSRTLSNKQNGLIHLRVLASVYVSFFFKVRWIIYFSSHFSIFQSKKICFVVLSCLGVCHPLPLRRELGRPVLEAQLRHTLHVNYVLFLALVPKLLGYLFGPIYRWAPTLSGECSFRTFTVREGTIWGFFIWHTCFPCVFTETQSVFLLLVRSVDKTAAKLAKGKTVLVANDHYQSVFSR